MARHELTIAIPRHACLHRARTSVLIAEFTYQTLAFLRCTPRQCHCEWSEIVGEAACNRRLDAMRVWNDGVKPGRHEALSAPPDSGRHCGTERLCGEGLPRS